MQEQRFYFKKTQDNTDIITTKYKTNNFCCQICKKENHEGLACTEAACIYCKAMY